MGGGIKKGKREPEPTICYIIKERRGGEKDAVLSVSFYSGKKRGQEVGERLPSGR